MRAMCSEASVLNQQMPRECLPRPWLRASRRAGVRDKAVPCPVWAGSVLEPELHGKVFFVVFDGELVGVFADEPKYEKILGWFKLLFQ